MLSERLPELVELEQLIQKFNGRILVEKLATVPAKGVDLPVYGMVFGSRKPEAPTVGFFAGVHGLERIGTRVLISYLRTLQSLMGWDQCTNDLLDRFRIVFMPIVNPTGMFMRRRSNFNGVDLMRNSPVESENKSRWVLVGGHRISPMLPWYRGKIGEEMQPEAKAVCDFVKRWIFPSKFSLTLDIHSGFGTVDRLWFPYAKSKNPFPDIHIAHAFKQLLDKTHPNHIYCVEPQAVQYTTHGDLWDYLYDEHQKTANGNVFIPWALELGSWLWVKKNPKQLFTVLGAFNPLIQHRYQRILRRHVALLDLFQKAASGYKNWAEIGEVDKVVHSKEAFKLWFENLPSVS